MQKTDFKYLETLFRKLVKEYVYGDTFIVLETITFNFDFNIVTIKFRYGIENYSQNNPEFDLNLKDISNTEYLRGRFTQYLDEKHLNGDIWEYKEEEK